jgi:hypothetical protein
MSALVAGAFDAPMHPVAHLGVMLLMPGVTRIAGVPEGSHLDGVPRNDVRALSAVQRGMCPAFNEDQIGWIIVRAVIVGVMHGPALWHTPPVHRLPDVPMEPNPISLEVEPAQVVPAPQKLLTRWRTAGNDHASLLWIRCVTAL